MPQRRLPDLADIPNRARESLAQARADWRAWRIDFRRDPGAFVHSPLFRIGIYVVLGVLALLAIRWLAGSLAPRDAAGDRPRGNAAAEIRVACTNPECLFSETVQVDPHFKAWPMTCKKCGQQTVYRAQRCRRCQQWFATAPGAAADCPHCNAQERLRRQKVKPASRPSNPDDAEDGWN